MSKKRRTRAFVALTAGLALIAAACGDDDDEPAASDAAPAATDAGTDPTTAETTADTPVDTASATTTGDSGAVTTTGDTGTTTGDTGTTTGDTGTGDTGSSTPGTGGGEDAPGATLTINLAEEAVWEDGSPITAADLECTWQASLNTPGSISTVGYDRISAVEAGESDKQVIVTFDSVFGPYKTLFNPIIKAAAVADCNDISGDFATELPISGRQYILQEWSESQSVMVPNESYWGDDPALTETVVMVPQIDTDTEIASILAGQVDYIYPQFGDALGTALQDPNIELDIQSGGDYEAFYFQQLDGPFADPVLREAFSMSIDRQAVFDQIYAPIFASADAEGELLNCGPIVQGPYCPEDNFQDTFDLEGATALLEGDDWERDGSGFWAKDGEAPEIRWMINAGNSRRENTQAFLIPLLAEAGFNVVADNCEAECVFQQRLPSLDYDFAMYISTAPPDPTYLTAAFTCAQVPSEENNNQGQNSQGWCNEEASAALEAADVTADEEERVELVQSALLAMDEDNVLLPLVNYPKSGAWRTDKVGGPLGEQTANFRAWNNFHQWEDLDGDGQLVIGAEQWPGCLNPVTECANSSWYVWTVSFPLLPGVWDTSADQAFEITNLVTEEPTVELEEG